MNTPRPGSYEAKRLGCRCDGASNGWGRGMPGSSDLSPLYDIHRHCPLHGGGYVSQPLEVEELGASGARAPRLRRVA